MFLSEQFITSIKEEEIMDVKELLEEAKKKEKKYTECPECANIAENLFERFPDVLADASRAKITYLQKLTDKSLFLGKCSRTTGKWSYLTGFDYVIEVWNEWWSTASVQEKEALLFHELSHIQLRTTNSGEKWTLRRHPLEEFPMVYKFYGAWSPALQTFESICKERLLGEKNEEDVN